MDKDNEHILKCISPRKLIQPVMVTWAPFTAYIDIYAMSDLSEREKNVCLRCDYV